MESNRYFLTFIFLVMSLFLSGQNVIYVNMDASGANNGSTWQDAYTDLSEAIEQTQSGDQVWVTAGVYVPTTQPNYDIGSSDQRFNHFTLKNGVTLLGGFSGDETSADQRDLEANKTVLSGDLDGDDDVEGEGYVVDHTKVNGDNLLKIFYFPPNATVDTTAVLDGFVLSGAVANNDVFPYMGGAAMLCQGASPKVVNCEFYGNYAKSAGGAIWIKNSSMIIENCTFSGNYAGSHAGAVCFIETSAKLKSCNFFNNSGKYGGAVYVGGGEDISLIEDCAFDGNSTLTGGNGGAISISSARVFAKNTSFTNNTADHWGGGVVFHGSCDVDIVNCDISSNTAGTYGGGIGAHSGSNDNRITVRITNTKVQGNEALGAGGGGISFRLNADGQIFNTLISGNKAAYVVSGLDVIASSVVDVTNTTIVDNVSGTAAIRVAGEGSKINIYNSIISHTGTDFNYDDAQKITMKSTRYTDADTNLYDSEDGIITDSPLFMNAPGHDGQAHTNGDYRLWGNSPVNNKASNTYLPKDVYDLDNDGDTEEPIPYDLDGKERVFAGVADLGCYEQQFESVAGNKLSLFDDQQVDMGDNLTLNNTDFTIETWIYPRQDAINANHHNICGNNDNGTGNRPPTLYIFQHDRIHYGYGDGTNWNAGDTEKALLIGQWNHIAMTFNDASNTLNIYANGQLLEQLVGVGEVSATPLKYLNSDQELRAYLDEFRVWKEERTQEELIATMNNTLSGNEDNLALYYSFDQVSSEEIEDQAGINNGTMINTPGIFNSDAILTPILKPIEKVGIDNFTISWYPVPDAFDYYIDVATDPEFKNLVRFGEPTSGATTYTVNGLSKGTVYYYKVTVRTNNDDWGRQYAHTATKLNPPGNALVFDGSTYINANDVTKYDFSGTTIETWVKVDAEQLNTRWALWACNPTDYLNNYVLFYGTNGEMFSLSQFDYNAGSWAGDNFDGSTLTADTWHHVAMVIDKDNNLGKLYLDGVDKGSFTPLADPYPYGSYFSIGQEFDDGAAASDFIKGSMDEFRIWSKPLTQAEIQANMYNTLTGNEADLVTYYNFDLQTGNMVIDNANIFDGEIVGTANWVASNAGLQDFTVEPAAQTTSGFTLTWNAVDGATNYMVDVATDAQFTNQVISSAATINETTYDATGLEQGIKYYFRVTTNQNDTSLTNYTNTLMEVPGNALVFDGKDDYIDISQVAQLGSKYTSTMECWAYMDPTETFARFIAINTSNGGNKYLLSYENNKGYVVYNANASEKYMASYVHTKGSWVHMAVTFDYNTAKFYLNGNLVSEVTGGNSPAIYPSNLISLGQEFDGDNASDFLKGAIDEVRFWDKTLTQSEIRANMHKKMSGDEAGLFAYYDFDQIEGQFLYEKVNGLDGTIIGDLQWGTSDAIITPLVSNIDEVTPNSIQLSWNAIENASDYYIEISTDKDFASDVTEHSTSETLYELTGLDEGTNYFVRLASETTRKSAWSKTLAINTLLPPPGNAYHFDGTNYISMDGVTNEDYSNGATIDLWVKPLGFSGDRGIIWANNTTTGGNHYFLMYNTIDKYLKLYSPYFSGPQIDINLNNTWNHVAVVLRKNAASYIYVNGIEKASFTASQNPLLANSLFSIGQEWDVDSNDNNIASDFYIGNIDEVRIWNKALSLAEIKSYYHTSIPGDEDGLVSYFNFDETEGNFVYDANGTYSGEVVGNTQRIESKALVTPFTIGATNITNEGFTANWDAIPNASNYYLKIATDPLLTNTVEGWESVETGNATSFDVTGLSENTIFYYGVMSETNRLSAWSPGSEPVKTTGGTTGELAANLSGTGNYIDLSNHIARFAGKNAGAITGWFKGTQYGNILKMTGATGNSLQLWLGNCVNSMADESIWFILERDNSLPLSMGIREGHNAYLDGEWHHFAVITGDGNNRVLIDGKERDLHFYNGNGNAQTQEFTNINGASSLHIGKDVSLTVDELAFYKNPITNNEVIERAHKKLTGNEIGLIAYYNFDNSNPNDFSGFGRNGVEEGAVSYVKANVITTPFLNSPQPGVTLADLTWMQVDSATEFIVDVAKDGAFQQKIVANQSTIATSYQVTGLDKNSKYFYRVKAKVDGTWSELSGKSEFFTLPGNALVLDGVDDGARMNNPITEDFTLELWVYPNENPIKNVEYKFYKGYALVSGEVANIQNDFGLSYLNNRIVFGVGDFDNLIDHSIYTADPCIYTHAWNHVAITREMKTGTIKIYVNGKLKAEQTNTTNQPLTSPTELFIGSMYGTNKPESNFNGSIDELRIWNKVLTREEIRANMNVSEPEGASESYIAHFTFDEIHTAEAGIQVFKDLAKQNDATLINNATIKHSEGVINPITLEPTDVTPGSFTLHLNDIASAQAYELEIAYDNTFVPPLAMHENIGKVSSFNAANLCPGVKYFYRVRAIYNENTISAWSTHDTVRTIDNGAVVNDFTATEGDYSGMQKLSWSCENSYLVSDFEIKRRIAGTEDEFEHIITLDNNDAYFYTDTTAAPGTYYEYTIQGLSYCYENDTEIDTSNVGFRLPEVSIGKDDGRIRLDWVYAENFAQNLEIVRKDVETGIEQVFQEVADSTHFNDTTMSLCVPYQYTLVSKTKNFGDVSAKPAIYTLEEDIFEAIDTLDASKGYKDGKVTLNWISHKQSIIDEYHISRRQYASGNDWEIVKIIDKGTTQVWIDEEAIPGYYYEYNIIGIGTCGNTEIFTDSAISVGFRQPEGVLNGQVSYEGGNPVRDVRIVANYDNSDESYGSCLALEGNGKLILTPAYDHFSFENGVTIEMWLKPQTTEQEAVLFANAGTELTLHSGGSINANMGSGEIGYNLVTDEQEVWNNDWNHVAMALSDTAFSIIINGQSVAYSPTTSVFALDSVNTIAENFTGTIDEFRLWNTYRNDSIIEHYHSIMLPREQEGLISTLRFDENLGEYAFDHTRTESEPNKNHAKIINGTWSKNTPSTARLALGAISEPTGNYQINGIWFTGSGETFSITPVYGVHEFDPATRSMLISENSLIYNNQDFTDISAFEVTGNVKYYGADFPVEGVMLYVDGQLVVDPEGAPVVTNEMGNFSIEVPIGDHFIAVSKMGHTFSQGFYPPKNAEGEVQYHNFNNPISNIQFVDSSFMIVAGRIVGGTIEGDKKLGFDKSNNNLGVCSFTVEAVKGYPIDGAEGSITVNTDPASGEYEVRLFPEQYSFVQTGLNPIGNELYNFNSIEDLNNLDLTSAPILNEETDSATIVEVINGDTIYTDTVYNYAYHHKRNWIYRSVPNIEVLNVNDEQFISDSTYYALDDNQDTVALSLIDENGAHAFNYPVFTKGKQYNTFIKVFEQYENADNNEIDRVPVNDGTVTVINRCGNYPAPAEYEISNGVVEYSFYGGFPNTTVDDLNPELNYTKTFEVHAATGNGGAIQSQWPDNGEYRAYVFGGIPTGNNFVTNGPDLVDFILRDPPGSNSHSYFEEGFTVSNTQSSSFNNSSASSVGVEVDLGWKVTTFVGFGAGVILENEQIANVETGIETEMSYSGGHSYNSTKTFNQSYSTSSDPLYVGDGGDLFFGHATNISYGVSNFIKPIIPGTGEGEIDSVYNGFTIGLKKAVNFGLEYSTEFIFTQNHIENYLIPDLEAMADYHSSNGNTDSAEHYVEQANHWRKVLGQNEYQKYVAKSFPHPEDKNISFDAGSIYEQSMTSEITETFTTEFEFGISASVASEVGIEIGGVGTTWSMSHETSFSETSGSENSTTESTTIGFVLEDGDQGDYFSVDILKDFYGNGPVFSTKGGQSSCPYEGGTVTEYADFYSAGMVGGFTNGIDLNLPTMRIEVPQISAVNSIISGVPDNQPAVFTLKLANLSEVNADNWYILKVDAASNPYGAKLRMDGASIVNGVAILVPGGTTLTKTLEFEKGRDDINSYENINLIMHSECQFDPTDDIEDIADTLSLTVNFIPTCSNVAITTPTDNWLVNVSNKDTLPVSIGEYNLQHNTLEKFAYQYRPASGSGWNTQAMFFHDTTDFASYSGEKYKVNGAEQITYMWDMTALQDRGYDIRVASLCTDESVYADEPLTGTLDGIRPQLFGAPSPADGILEPNDEIMVTFNEPIEEGLVTYYNIDVEGVLNGSEIDHGTSLMFDGYEDYAATPAGINLQNKSYTLEFWAQKTTDASGTVISQGLSSAENIDVRFAESDIVVVVNGNTYVAANPLNNEQWHHYAVVYNNDTELLKIFVDDQILLEETNTGTSASGEFIFGKSNWDTPEYFAGKLHDVRIWKRPLSYTDIIEQMNIRLNGNEVGLFANWPMDEGQGSIIEEIVHSRHANNFATWLVEPSSTGYALNGIDQSLIIEMGAIPVIEEMDMTLELWFKGTSQSGDTYLFSNGDPAQDVYEAAKTIGIKLNNEGKVVIESNNITLSSTESYTDDQWHHVAVVINRRAYASLYIDGEKVNSLPAPEFGSMESAFGYIGALGYMNVSQEHQFSNYFSGNVDEMRIWKTARKQEQIELYMNTRLSGTEAGLIGYFPFETYEEEMGVLTSTPTLEDQSIDPNSAEGFSHCGALSVVGSETMSEVAPNIKRERPKQSVNFDYVINNDKIIITPTDGSSMIENTILEITVKNIEDKHGNKLASPASWTAFINKNQVQWENNFFEFEKEIEESLSFEAVIKNNSGIVQPFTLSNMPSWLTVSPISGTIQPDDEITVSFNVADGINIGNYDEDIYLQASSGFNERLTLDLRVYKQAPDWSVDESQYDASMNIISQVSVINIFSSDQYDMIGVFSEDECRGVAHLEYKQNYDDYFAFLVVYGNSSEEQLTYKFWDASEGKVFTDVVPVYSFEPNALFGSMADPVLFNVGIQENNTIQLIDGWKWMSFNLEINEPEINNVLDGLAPQPGDIIKHNNLFASYDAALNQWIGSLNAFEIGKLYRLKYSSTETFNYQGAAISPATQPITISEGWNRIGYTPSVNLTVNEALAGFEPQVDDVIKGQFEFAIFDGYEWIGSLNYMQPAAGYMYKSLNSETFTFTYPASGNMKSSVVINPNTQLENGTIATDFEYSMSVIARVNIPFTNGDRLNAYIDNELAGEASIITDGINRGYCFITVYGNEEVLNQDIEFRLLSQTETIELQGQATFKGNTVEGTLTMPVELNGESTVGNLGNGNFNSYQIYPNPFNEKLVVTVNLNKSQQVKVEIFNMIGRKEAVITDKPYAPGEQSILWDGKDAKGNTLSTGIYFIHIHSDSLDRIVKVVKK